MKKYKAIITDYDNTLVGFNQKIKKNVKKKIIQFTGVIQEVCKTLKLTAPQIVFGGAQIINPVDESVLWEERIPAQESNEVINFL